MSIEGQGHFFTIYFPGFVCFVLYLAKISGERLQDHWSSGFLGWPNFYMCQKLKGFYGKACALAEFLEGVSIVRYPHIE